MKKHIIRTLSLLVFAALLAGVAGASASFSADAPADGAAGGAAGGDVISSAVAAGGDAAGSGEAGALDISDPEIPLAGWSLMWLDAPEDAQSVVCYDKESRDGGSATVFVPLSYEKDGKLYFFGYPYNSYYIEANPKEFSDVAGHWASDNIYFVAMREAALGFPDGSYDPNAQMTRAMLATVLARLIIADLSDFNYRLFDDVEPDVWYGPSVAWAFEYGVVEGIGGGKFDPNGNVTRQDMSLMIERFLDAFGIDLLAPAGDDAADASSESDGPSFIDEDRIGFWAADAVAHMHKCGIMLGRPGGLFDPRGFSTRAEVATVLFRLVESAVTEAYNRL